MKNKWGDKMQDKKNGVTRQRQKKWGDETRDKKNGETRHETKKNGDKKMGG